MCTAAVTFERSPLGRIKEYHIIQLLKPLIATQCNPFQSPSPAGSVRSHHSCFPHYSLEDFVVFIVFRDDHLEHAPSCG